MALRYQDDENIIARAFGYYFVGEGYLSMIPATLQLTTNGLYLFDHRRAENRDGVMYAHLEMFLPWRDFDIIGESLLGDKRYIFAPYFKEKSIFTFISDTVSFREMRTLIKDLKNIGIPFA